MVRRIKALAAASSALLEGLRGIGSSSDPSGADDDDAATIDVLVRNAFRQDSERKANVTRIWSELSSRVMGPFGTLAIEGPAFSHSEGAVASLSHHGRDLQASSLDGSSMHSALDEVCNVCMYRGADSSQMNLR